MASDATRTIALGTVVKWDPTGSTTWETIGCVEQITPANGETEMVDASCIDDTREQMIPGINKAGEFEFTALWRSGDDLYEDLQASRVAKDEPNWRMVTSHATPVTETFRGFIKSVGRPQVGKGDVFKCNVVVVTTSEPVLS